MKKIRLLSGLSLLILLLTNCTNLSELPTSWGDNPVSKDVVPTGFNTETKTGWMSFNDSTHIYFAFSYFDPRIQSRILTTGMTVYIDTTGRMKKDCFVRYPIIRQAAPVVTAGQRIQPRQGAGGRGQRPGVGTLLNKAEEFDLQWQKGKDIMIQINPIRELTGFNTSIGLDSSNILNMIIGVPLKMINPAGIRAIDKLVIGLQFGEPLSGSEMGGGRSMSGGGQSAQLGGRSAGSGGGGGGGRGGGGGGGGGRGGSGGSGGGQMSSGGGRSGPDMAPVEFWYKTRIAKKIKAEGRSPAPGLTRGQRAKIRKKKKEERIRGALY